MNVFPDCQSFGNENGIDGAQNLNFFVMGLKKVHTIPIL
jgi:hypothetical protein